MEHIILLSIPIALGGVECRVRTAYSVPLAEISVCTASMCMSYLVFQSTAEREDALCRTIT